MQVLFLDCSAPFVSGGKVLSSLMPDALHPNGAGTSLVLLFLTAPQGITVAACGRSSCSQHRAGEAQSGAALGLSTPLATSSWSYYIM